MAVFPTLQGGGREVGLPLVGMLAAGDVIFNVGVELLCKSDWILHDLVPRGQI